MGANNSIQRYTNPSTKETQETIGVVNFGAGQGKWDTTIGGLTYQGGITTGPGPTVFSVPIQKQLLFITLAGGTVSGITSSGFTASAAGYWFAIST